ncbi:MAG: nucleotidyltransferase family protein [Pelovirga sp.]
MTRNLTAIVLAAGRSRRMGCSKPLLPLGGRTVLQQVLLALEEAQPDRILVVLGAQGKPVADSLADFAVSILWNRLENCDMVDSLRTALPLLPQKEHGVIICLGDQPLIAPATYRHLADHYQAHPDAIVQPRCKDRKGHPVLVPSKLLQELVTYPTLRDLLTAYAERLQLVDVDDPGILMDLDTPADYQRVLHYWK